MEHGIELGANASDEEQTGLFKRPVKPSLAGLPLAAGWIDEAIALLDSLESEPIEIAERDSAVPVPVPVPDPELRVRASPWHEVETTVLPTDSNESTVLATRPVASTPAPAARRRTSPLSYMGSVKPFNPARTSWRPRSRSRALA